MRRLAHAPTLGSGLDTVGDGTQQRRHLGVRHLDAEQARQARAPQRHPNVGCLRRRLLAATLPARPTNRRVAARDLHRPRLAPRDLEQQRGRAFERRHRQARIDAALEALRGVGEQSQPARAARNRVGREMRGLEQHRRRGIRNRGAAAAHDGAQPHHAARVRDHHVIRIERVLLVVEQDRALAGPGISHRDAAGETLEIVRMQRLAQFGHHIIGDIDDGGNAVDADVAQPLAQPRRRLTAAPHAADHAACEHRHGRRDIDGGRIHRFVARRHRRHGQGQIAPLVRRRVVARDAEHAHAVAAVRRGVHFERGIIEIERLANVLTQRQ